MVKPTARQQLRDKAIAEFAFPVGALLGGLLVGLVVMALVVRFGEP
jgi:hypothetical protein